MLFLGGFAVMALILVAWCWFGAYDHDEVQHLHASWLVAQGSLPFVDFLEQHHPTFWYLLAPIVRLGGSPHVLIASARFFDLAMLAVLIIIVVRIVRNVFPGVSGAWPVLLLVGSSLFLQRQLEVRPDALMNVVGWAGLWQWIVYLQRGGRVRAFVAGLLSGVAIALLQKWIPFFGLMFLGSFVLLIRNRRDVWYRRMLGEGMGLVLLGALIPVALLFLAIGLAGYWREFFFWAYTFNRFFYLESMSGELGYRYKAFAELVRGGGVLMLCGLGGVGILWYDLLRRWRPSPETGGAGLVLGVMVVGSIPYLVSIHLLFPQYFLPVLPLMAICSQALFTRIRGRSYERIVQAVVIVSVIVAGSALALGRTNLVQRATHRLILEKTRAEAPLFFPPPAHPIIRRDGAYFWYNGIMIAETYERYCQKYSCAHDFLAQEAERWRVDPPRYLYLSEHNPKAWPYRWREHLLDYEPMNMIGLFHLKGDEDELQDHTDSVFPGMLPPEGKE